MQKTISRFGKERYYYEKGDTIIQVSTKKIFTVEEVYPKQTMLATTDKTLLKLSEDIKPTFETFEKAKLVEPRKYDNKDIYFAKIRNSVIIPSKREEDGGLDLYANFEEDYIIIPPHATLMIPTGLYCAFSSDFVMILKERGSTGIKGMAQRCGVIDSGYRGEILVPISNLNDTPIVITKPDVVWTEEAKKGYIIHSTEKAIAQALMVRVPKLRVVEISLEELKAIPSERKDGKLGSSNK